MQLELSTTGCWIDKTAAHCLAAQSVLFRLREYVYIYIYIFFISCQVQDKQIVDTPMICAVYVRFVV